MEGQLVVFSSQEDAQKVFEQLPEAKIIGNQVYHRDKRALELAISTADISNYQLLGGSHRVSMSYPEAEFTYNGDSPRIHVRCLAAYNSGFLHGLWIDASKHPNDIQDDINFMLSWSPVAHVEACEEWAIHSYEGFGCYHLSAYEDLEIVSSVAKAIKEYGEVLAAYLCCEYPDHIDMKDKSWDELIEQFQSAFVGHFENERHFALTSEEVEELYNFKGLQKDYPFWSNNIDWEGVAIDLFCSNYYYTKATDKEYGIYVFRNLSHPNP